MSNMVLKAVLELKDNMTGQLNRAGSSVSGFAKSVGSNLMNIKAGFDMAFGAISAIAGRFASTIKEAFRFETQTIQFAVLMKSMTAAKERMAELAIFAAATPFQLGEIVQASRQLHVFTGGVLGSTASLRLVGNAAAAVGTTINDLSFWIGRAYAAIKGGLPFGEATMRLMELGVITPEVRTKMEELQAAGASNIEVWGVLEKRLNSFSGGMKTLSESGDGLVSTMQDNWTEAVRSFGQALEPIAKTYLKDLIAALNQLNSSGAIAEWATRAITALESVGGAARAVGKAIGAVWNYSGLSDAWAVGKGLVGSAVGTVTDVAKGNFGSILDNQNQNLGAGAADGFYIRKVMKWAAGKGNAAAQNALDVSQEGQFEAVRNRAAAAVVKPAAATKTAAQEDADSKKKIASDMAAAQKDVDKRLAEAASKKAAEELAKRLKEEETARMALEKKLADEAFRLSTDNLRKESDVAKEDQSKAASRLSTAHEQAAKAWGWYRDKETLKTQIVEEKANAAAEKQFKSDFSRLQSRRSDWRSAANLSLEDEAVRRVGVAREEERAAAENLRAIEENTRELAAKLDELLTMKGGI